MPFKYRIDTDAHLAVLQFQGRVTGMLVREAITTVAGDGGWQPGYNTLWDCRQIEELDMEPADIGAVAGLAHSLKERLGAGKGAVVTRRELDRDIAKLLVIRMKDGIRDRRIFHRLSDALEWLGLDGTTDPLDQGRWRP